MSGQNGGLPKEVNIMTTGAEGQGSIFENDSLYIKQFVFDEDAINTISTMMGFTTTEILAEEDKESPDMAKIEELERSRSVMSRERQEIYRGNNDVKRSVIERYTPIIRALLAETHAEIEREEAANARRAV
jgi:hypothetical protein